MKKSLKKKAPPRLPRWFRRLVRLGIIATLGVVSAIIGCNVWVQTQAGPRVFSDIDALPTNPVGLVLGTSSRFKSGRPNLFFKYRIEAAAAAYQRGKVSHLLVSGDNRNSNYNEPQEMKNHLVKLGIPESAITLDYAGLRTLDSVVRSKKIFGQSKLTIITQRAHAERAIFIAQHHNLDVVALSAKDVPLQFSMRTRVREWFARCKAVLDVFVLKKQPYHLGDPEPITPAASLSESAGEDGAPQQPWRPLGGR